MVVGGDHRHSLKDDFAGVGRNPADLHRDVQSVKCAAAEIAKLIIRDHHGTQAPIEVSNVQPRFAKTLRSAARNPRVGMRFPLAST